MKKKIIIAFLIISSILLLAGCNKTATDRDSMIEIAREEISIADAETVDIQIIGSIDKGESRLVCFMTGNQYQSHRYFPIEFKTISHEKYEFVKVFKVRERGLDMKVQEWKDGYVFIVNNDACKNIKIVSASGEAKRIEVSKIPFLFYYEGIPSEYNFLDIEGNVLN